MPSAQLDDAKVKMSAIRASFAREAAEVRNNGKYSDAGRVHALAKSLLAHRKQAAALRASFHANNEDVRAVSVARLFGIPKGADAATVIAYRDAADRAAKIADPDEAAARLTSATEMGDNLMARAIAGHAYTRKWNAVTEAFAENAGLSDDLADLNSVPSGGLLKTGLNALFAVPTPLELRSNTDNELQRIAEGE
jgi:stage V sporulation protein SpoVS